jgi:hypothetical protein
MVRELSCPEKSPFRQLRLETTENAVYFAPNHICYGAAMLILSRRFVISLMAAIIFFLVADHIVHKYKCDDCFQPHGWPWAYYHEGGYAGGEGYEWKGVAADSVAAFTVAIAITGLWTSVRGRGGRPKPNGVAS